MTLPPLTSLRRFDTHRLLPAKYSQNYESVLTRLVDDRSAVDDLQNIFALDNATNARLLAEEGRALDMTARELVYNVPQAHVINAAFTHPNPLGARFSSPRRGAWYAAFELATSKAEVLFHKQVEFAEINWQEREEVIYDDYLADFTATFHDIRDAAVDGLLANTPETLAEQATLAEQVRGNADEAELSFPAPENDPKSEEKELTSSRIDANSFAECLSATSYVASENLAEELLRCGSLGLIYPSVRKPGGTCIACFQPSIVANVRKGPRYKLLWTPTRANMVRA